MRNFLLLWVHCIPLLMLVNKLLRKRNIFRLGRKTGFGRRGGGGGGGGGINWSLKFGIS